MRNEPLPRGLARSFGLRAERDSLPAGCVVWHVLHVPTGGRDVGLAQIAAAQDGLITADQLGQLGLDRSAIAHRVRHRRLLRVLPRVYLAGPGRLTERVHLAAPLLWPATTLTPAGAAALWLWACWTPRGPGRPGHSRRRASRREPPRGQSPPRPPPRCPGRPHSARTPGHEPRPRAARLRPRGHRRSRSRSASAARLSGLTSDHELANVLDRHQRRPGTARLRRVLATEQGTAVTRSEAERRFLRLLAEADLPRPEVNARAAGFEVDFLWRPEALVVEIDGYRYHSGRATGS